MSEQKAAAGKAPSKRLFEYDLARAIAILFVVAVHSLAAVDVSSSLGNYYVVAGQALFFTGNLIFFMMSGKFNLRLREGDDAFKTYYYRKVRNILIPIAVMFVIRTFYITIPQWAGWRVFIKELVKNSAFAFDSMEYWFVFTLCGFLLVGPYLAKAVNGLTKFQKWVFLGIALGWNLVNVTASNLGYSFMWGYLFAGCASIFCIGYFVEDLFDTPKKRHILYVIAAVCFVLTIWLAVHGYRSGVNDVSPIYILLALGIYLGVVQLGKRIDGNKFISLVAKHSFSIYLIHMMILMPLSGYFAFGGVASFGGHILLTIVVMALSLLGAVVLDFIIMEPLKKLMDRIASALKARGQA